MRILDTINQELIQFRNRIQRIQNLHCALRLICAVRDRSSGCIAKSKVCSILNVHPRKRDTNLLFGLFLSQIAEDLVRSNNNGIVREFAAAVGNHVNRAQIDRSDVGANIALLVILGHVLGINLIIVSRNKIGDSERVVIVNQANLTRHRINRTIVHACAEQISRLECAIEFACFLQCTEILIKLVKNLLIVFRGRIHIPPCVYDLTGILYPGVTCEFRKLSRNSKGTVRAALHKALPARDMIQLAVLLTVHIHNILSEHINNALTILCNQIVQRHQIAVNDRLCNITGNPACDPRQINSFTGSQHLVEFLLICVKRNYSEFNLGVRNIVLKHLVELLPDHIGVLLLTGAGEPHLDRLFFLLRGFLRIGLLILGSCGLLALCLIVCCVSCGLFRRCTGNHRKNHDCSKKQREKLFHFASFHTLSFLIVIRVFHSKTGLRRWRLSASSQFRTHFICEDSQPFTAPMVRPCEKYFWKNGNARTGKMPFSRKNPRKTCIKPEILVC